LQSGLVRVRVRGIYATALTELMLRAGFQVVQASQVIASRFGIPQLELPADVTLKHSEEEPSELVVVGYTWAVERVLGVLRRELPYSFYWVSRLPLHATVKARVIGVREGRCLASVGGVEAELVTDECPEPGALVVAGVVRPGVKPGEVPRLVPGPRVIGDYAILYRGEKPRVSISEHVRSREKRAELMSIAADYTSRGYSVHWRSSARGADAAQLRSHLEELARLLEETAQRAEEGDEGVYSEGETVAVIRLSRPDKERLDELRSRTTPTMPWHHSVKSTAPELGVLVDYAEKLIPHGVEGEKLLLGLLDYLAERLQQSRTVRIVHVKPSGEVITLGEATVASASREDGRLVVVLERRVRSRGVYDGLGVEKEPGDRIETVVDTGSWVVKHTYYSRSGEVKGTYYNINTPPEVTPDAIVYLDLEVDVVKTGEGARILDVEALEEWTRLGVITEELKKRALEEAERAAGKLQKPTGAAVTQ